jgi:hypothetical protein
MIAIISSRLKPGQGMLPSAPQTLNYNLDDIH